MCSRSPRLLVVSLAVVFLLVGCGSKKTASITTTTTAKRTTSTATTLCNTTSTTAAGGKDYSPPGDIPDNQAFVTYSGASYKLDTPEGWARSDDKGAVTFTDKLNSIRIEVLPAATAPTVNSATNSEAPPLQTSKLCAKNVKVSAVTRTAGPAVLLTYQSDALPDPVTGKVVHDDVERYEFWKDGREAILTLSGSIGSDNVDPWKRVTNSFAWTQ